MEAESQILDVKLIRKTPTTLDFKKILSLYQAGSTFVAFDTETTGLQGEKDSILEIGAVKFNKDGIIGNSFDSLVNPHCIIPPYITEINGISNEMVSDAPDTECVLKDFLLYIGDAILVAHNAPFDVKFVNASLYRNDLPQMKNLTIDTLPLVRKAYPYLQSESTKGQYRLQSLAKRFNIQVHNAHRAEDDARVCKELFEKIIKDIK